MNEFKATETIGTDLVYVGKSNRIDTSVPLSKEERKQFNFHLKKISESIKKKNKATSDLIIHVNELLTKQLWRENYKSPDDFIQDVLRINESYYYRYAKANRTYLYLYDKAQDEDERITLSLMTEAVYRELRLIATDRHSNMNVKGEDIVQYKERLKLIEVEQLELIKLLWDSIYPHLKKTKENQSKILPSGGFMLNTTDVIRSCSELAKVLGGYLDNPETLDIEKVKEIKKQKNRIELRLSDGHVWDKYEGVIKIINGRLVIENRLNSYDLAYELSDLIENKTPSVISIRRSNKSR